MKRWYWWWRRLWQWQPEHCTIMTTYKNTDKLFPSALTSGIQSPINPMLSSATSSASTGISVIFTDETDSPVHIKHKQASHDVTPHQPAPTLPKTASTGTGVVISPSPLQATNLHDDFLLDIDGVSSTQKRGRLQSQCDLRVIFPISSDNP